MGGMLMTINLQTDMFETLDDSHTALCLTLIGGIIKQKRGHGQIHTTGGQGDHAQLFGGQV